LPLFDRVAGSILPPFNSVMKQTLRPFTGVTPALHDLISAGTALAVWQTAIAVSAMTQHALHASN
jgi:hypothetical protein